MLIVGPTASGKTEVALRLAEAMGGEIISADSMQVYRGMDIGTAKPTPVQRARVRHHLLDVVDPDEDFDASRYERAARSVIAELHAQGTPVFVVGGTGLYIKALLGGLFAGPGAVAEWRAAYRERLTREGCPALYALLAVRDPQAAAGIRPGDAVRIMRALEVLDATGESIVNLRERHRFSVQRYETLKLGLRLERGELRQRIAVRTEAMFSQGLLGEVERLLAEGYGDDLKPMRAIGYRHALGWLRGRYGSLAEAVAAMSVDTCRYAKRQRTWFKTDPEIAWFDPSDMAEMQRRIAAFHRGQYGQST